MKITITADSVSVTPDGFRSVDVALEGVDENKLMENLTVKDFISHFGVSSILDEIGERECIDHFALSVNPEE